MDYLYIDADEDHAHLQFQEKKGDLEVSKSGRKKNGVITKLIYVYEGVRPVAPKSKRHRLIGTHYFCRCTEDNKALWDEVYEYIDTHYDLTIRNSRYAIVPVSSLAGDLAVSIGYKKHMAVAIRLAVEEMLNERITNAYSGTGDIRVKITLMPDWLRISFSDNGVEYYIDKRRDTSASAKIILAAVSDFHTGYMNGKPVYCMDFVYEKEIDIQEFLLKSMEEE